MSDKVNISNLLALRDASRAKPSDLTTAYAYTKAVLNAADVLLDLAHGVCTWADCDPCDEARTERELTKHARKVTL